MNLSTLTATLQESFEASVSLFMTFLPKTLGALMLLGLGLLLGKIRGSGNWPNFEHNRSRSMAQWHGTSIAASKNWKQKVDLSNCRIPRILARLSSLSYFCN